MRTTNPLDVAMREASDSVPPMKPRGYNVLMRESNGHVTVGDVLGITFDDLVAMRNMGHAAAHDVLRWRDSVRHMLDPAPDLTDPQAVQAWLNQETP